ncbi:C-terminal helicase domain-containing protein, partial [Streptococcus agalactiae]|uniref:C-terminal helicase domain-containing protein n=2 Tax=Lactobacillales TaxID=186826 RepID=UPI002556CC97
SGKFDYYRNLLDRVLQDDKRVLVFSQFTSMLDILEEDLKAEGVTYFRIDGQTKKGDRQSQVDAFNHGEGSVFLISLRAGGVGINLTGADTVFLYDLWWNPSIEEQAIGRAH